MKISNKPQRYGWAPGKYLHSCLSCEESYSGDKRSNICADCAYALPFPTPTPPDEKSQIDQLRACLMEYVIVENGFGHTGQHTAEECADCGRVQRSNLALGYGPEQINHWMKKHMRSETE